MLWLLKIAKQLSECCNLIDTFCREHNHQIGHFRIASSLCFKARLSAKPLAWKWFFILMQIKLIFTFWYLASFFESEGFTNSTIGLYSFQWINHHISKSWYETQMQWIEYETELKDLKSSSFISKRFWQNAWS